MSEERRLEHLTEVHGVIVNMCGRGRNARYIKASTVNGRFHIYVAGCATHTVGVPTVEEMMRRGLLYYHGAYRLTTKGRGIMRTLRKAERVEEMSPAGMAALFDIAINEHEGHGHE